MSWPGSVPGDQAGADPEPDPLEELERPGLLVEPFEGGARGHLPCSSRIPAGSTRSDSQESTPGGVRERKSPRRSSAKASSRPNCSQESGPTSGSFPFDPDFPGGNGDAGAEHVARNGDDLSDSVHQPRRRPRVSHEQGAQGVLQGVGVQHVLEGPLEMRQHAPPEQGVGGRPEDLGRAGQPGHAPAGGHAGTGIGQILGTDLLGRDVAVAAPDAARQEFVREEETGSRWEIRKEVRAPPERLGRRRRWMEPTPGPAVPRGGLPGPQVGVGAGGVRLAGAGDGRQVQHLLVGLAAGLQRVRRAGGIHQKRVELVEMGVDHGCAS
jgi:hypothetical protein